MDREKMKRMDSAQRLEAFNANEILRILDINGDETILDIGAGTGAFSVPIADKLVSGHLFAYDMDSEVLIVLENKIKDQRLNNITPVLLDENETVGQSDVNKIFICTVLHEIENKDAFIDKYKKLLSKNGKLYIVEFTSSRRGGGETEHTKRHFISSDDSKALLEAHFSKVTVHELNELVYMCVCE